MYIIISGYYVTKRLCSELPAGCLSCFICWLRFLVFNQNFLFLLLLHSLNSGQPTSVSVKTKRKQFGGVAMTHTHTHTHTHTPETCRLFSFQSAVQQEMGKWLLCSSATRQKKKKKERKKAPWRCSDWGSVAACMSADLLFTSSSSSHVGSVPMGSHLRCTQDTTSIYSHYCAGPVLIIIRRTDAQTSPQSKMNPHVLYVSVSGGS